jgi:hypothetical protein
MIHSFPTIVDYRLVDEAGTLHPKGREDLILARSKVFFTVFCEGSVFISFVT